MLEKVRTKRKAWERVIELTKADAARSRIEKMAVLHVAAPDDAHELESLLRSNLDCPDEIIISGIESRAFSPHRFRFGWGRVCCLLRKIALLKLFDHSFTRISILSIVSCSKYETA